MQNFHALCRYIRVDKSELECVSLVISLLLALLVLVKFVKDLKNFDEKLEKVHEKSQSVLSHISVASF